MDEIVIVSARRTPFGRFLGGAATLTAADLGVAAGEAALAAIDRAAIDLVVVGNVIGAGLGMNVARQIALRLGIPQEAPAYAVNQMCASGMRAVIAATQAIATGEAETVLCGGVESMSNAPQLARRDAKAAPLGDDGRADALLRDGLVDPLLGHHMALTAEELARRYAIGRREQDAFAARSHRAYADALAAGRYAAEFAPTPQLERDEQARADASVEKLATLKTPFLADGTVTAGNASGVNDGAAMLVLTSASVARRRGWPALARVAGWATVGCDPALMGLGPVHALRRLCERSGIDVSCADAIELNEAFAVQALACCRELELDPSTVNTDGGAIAVGHPIGATGARLVAHLAHGIACGRSRLGVASLCVGGGMGAAIALTQ